MIYAYIWSSRFGRLNGVRTPRGGIRCLRQKTASERVVKNPQAKDAFFTITQMIFATQSIEQCERRPMALCAQSAMGRKDFQ